MKKKNLTWVHGGSTDETSGKNLSAGRKSAGAEDFGTHGNASEQTGTSIFDPVLTELCYRWFCPPGGMILDPFAGGSVRGIVAAFIDRHYHGIDLRPEQVVANVQQARQILGAQPKCRWVTGDSLEKLDDAPEADFVFSCPPYADLEVYSNDPKDLSRIAQDDYQTFLTAYREIIRKSVAKLKDNRFACFVVGEVRDPKGNYRDFIGDTVQAFRDAGAEYYNEAILVTAAGSLPIRAGRQFATGRKLGKTHQNVLVFQKGLVFVKGDGKKAAIACGTVEVDEALFWADMEQKLNPDTGVTDNATTEPPLPTEPPEIPIVREHEGILVVRDDLIPGGTKARLAPLIFRDAEEIVYASPVYGYAQIAIAHAAAKLGKKATIFCAQRKQLHPRTAEAQAAGAKIEQVPSGYLTVVTARAKEYCERTGATLAPFGLDTPEIIEALAAIARSVKLDKEPEEVWTVAGSGVLTRSLQLAWPNATFHAVQVGAEPDAGRAIIHEAPEKFEQDAKTKPPFPSCPNYDAKAWSFIKKNAKPGALFWNVAA